MRSLLGWILVGASVLMANVAVADQGSLVDVAKALNLTKFVEAITKTGVDKVINHEGTFTVFAPSDEAFAREKKYPNEDVLKDKMLFHIARGTYNFKDIKDEAVVKSLLSKRTIRFNIYPNGKTTANGREVVSTDHAAHNGVIHIVDNVMSAVYTRAGSVVSELDECCPHHSELTELVKLAGLFDTLDTKGPYTFIAPNNGAFDKLHPDYIIHLKKNVTALRSLLLGHVVPLTWYSVGFQDGQSVKALNGNKIPVSVASDGTIKLSKATVTLADVTAENGVVHSVDTVLFPLGHNTNNLGAVSINSDEEEDDYEEEEEQEPADFITLLNRLGYTSFARALKLTKVDDIITSKGSFTLFAVPNHEFDHPDAYPVDFTLEDRVRFHVARGVAKASKVSDGDRMLTLLKKRFVRFNVYVDQQTGESNVVTANGQRASFGTPLTHSAPNGVVVELERGMDYVYGRNGTLYAEIARIRRFARFRSFLEESGLVAPLVDSQYTYTVLVPSDKVFNALVGDSEAKTLSHVFLNHIVPDVWYSEGLRTRDSVSTLGGKKLDIDVDQNTGTIRIGSATIVKADFSAKNGVFHEVDALI